MDRKWIVAILAALCLTLWGPLAVTSQPLPTKREWQTGPVLDQRFYPACVGYSVRAMLEAGPNPYVYASPSAMTIYLEAQKRDQWAGENYAGSDVHGAMLYLEEQGIIKQTRWSTDTLVLAQFILNSGPVVVGQPWTYSMDYVDHDRWQHVAPTDLIRGYHAIMYYGVDLHNVDDPNDDELDWQNSWGTGFWGGRGKILRTELQAQLDRPDNEGAPEGAMAIKYQNNSEFFRFVRQWVGQ